ncbi:hypothetical protein B0H14DRAFT_2602327 [Mycena olivaceomarginata]|nr:hypothetical protein B0H14DRAFT_2602327 [Mycena olivaceomarginata]
MFASDQVPYIGLPAVKVALKCYFEVRRNVLWMKETLVLPEPHQRIPRTMNPNPRCKCASLGISVLWVTSNRAAIEHWESFTCQKRALCWSTFLLHRVQFGKAKQSVAGSDLEALSLQASRGDVFSGDVEARLWFNWLETKDEVRWHIYGVFIAAASSFSNFVDHNSPAHFVARPQTAALSAIMEYLLPKATEIDRETCIVV